MKVGVHPGIQLSLHPVVRTRGLSSSRLLHPTTGLQVKGSDPFEAYWLRVTKFFKFELLPAGVYGAEVIACV